MFAPQRVGTGLPPVTKKKSVEHWPLKSGGLMSKVSKSMRICNKKSLKVIHAKKQHEMQTCVIIVYTSFKISFKNVCELIFENSVKLLFQMLTHNC